MQPVSVCVVCPSPLLRGGVCVGGVVKWVEERGKEGSKHAPGLQALPYSHALPWRHALLGSHACKLCQAGMLASKRQPHFAMQSCPARQSHLHLRGSHALPCNHALLGIHTYV
eukprot:1157312-Pelagomonas_calceolata.AAC.10